MSVFFAVGLDLSQWQNWIIPLSGAGFTVVALVMGRAYLRPRQRTSTATESGPRIDPFVHGSPSERRTAVRRSGKLVRALLSYEDAKTAPVEGWIADRSVGGLCLNLRAPISQGTILSIRAAEAPEIIPWVQIEVRSCRAKEGEYELGCQFIRTPSWNIMLTFG
jgi:hypothetical protein